MHARSGLRYVDQDSFRAPRQLGPGPREEKLAHFAAAVRQAEAAYGIEAQEPLFFTWTQDPLAMVMKEADGTLLGP